MFMATGTKKSICALGIACLLCGVIYGGNIKKTTAQADVNYAAIKGFTVDSKYFQCDYDKELVSISDYGNMSLWAARYGYYNASNNKLYVTYLVEAKLCSLNNSSKYAYNNSNMNILITHENFLDTNIIAYDPLQTSSQYTVSRTVTMGASSSDVSLGYSYQTSEVYSDISYTHTSYYIAPASKYDEKSLAIEYNYDFSQSKSNTSKISPYAGEIVQKLSLTLEVDYTSCPSGYDTDDEEFYLTYSGTIKRVKKSNKSATNKTSTIKIKFYDLGVTTV